MKKNIVVRLENVLVKKFDVEKSYEMLVKRMEKQGKDVEKEIQEYKEDVDVDWKEMKMRELKEKYEEGFERKEMYAEGKRVLEDLLGLKKMNESLGDMRIVVVSEMGVRKVKGLLKNNGLDEKGIEVRKIRGGEIGECLKEKGVMKESYEKTVVLSSGEEDMEECEKLGVKCEMCGSGDIYGVIGLRKR